MSEIVWRKVLIRTSFGVNVLANQPERSIHPDYEETQSEQRITGRLPGQAFLWVQVSNEQHPVNTPDHTWVHVLYHDPANGLQQGWIEDRYLTWYDTPELENVAKMRMELDALEARLRGKS